MAARAGLSATGSGIQIGLLKVQGYERRDRTVTAALFVTLLGIYLAAGLCVAAAFVTVGIGRVLPHQMTFTPIARLFLFPGSAALWPYVLYRWLAASRS